MNSPRKSAQFEDQFQKSKSILNTPMISDIEEELQSKHPLYFIIFTNIIGNISTYCQTYSKTYGLKSNLN